MNNRSISIDILSQLPIGRPCGVRLIREKEAIIWAWLDSPKRGSATILRKSAFDLESGEFIMDIQE